MQKSFRSRCKEYTDCNAIGIADGPAGWDKQEKKIILFVL
jgi:hypothetical protein